MSLIVDGTTGVTFNDSSLQGAAASPYVLKNRIINGAMVIDQRNAGASITPTNLQYTLDRWAANLSQSSKFTLQQNAGSVTPPAGFSNYLGITSSSAYSILAGDFFGIYQLIEGFNTADLDFGKSTAKTITLSFWVRSSLTGTFGGALNNFGQSRSYPFSYTISTANTWEQKSITIAGDTTGTWVGATNNIGIQLQFSLGTGTTYSGTAGAWAGTTYVSVPGATSVVGTNGATFYITGVQLEIGSTATPFERRLYNQELANCQRYLPAFGGSAGALAAGFCSSTIYGFANVVFPVTTRTAPTGITVPNVTYWSVYGAGATAYAATAATFSTASTTSSSIYFTVASGLGAGQGTIVTANNASAQLLFTGCEL